MKEANDRLKYLRKLITQVSKKLNFWGSHVFRVDGYIYVVMFKYIPGDMVTNKDDGHGSYITTELSHRFFKREKVVKQGEIEDLITDALLILNDEKHFDEYFKNK